MTLPWLQSTARSFVATRLNWLGRYLAVEKAFDQNLYNAMSLAAEDIDKAILDTLGSDLESVKQRRLQLAYARKQIRARLKELFGTVGNTIKDQQADAAVAATKATIRDQKQIIGLLFPDPTQRDSYIASLQQSAERNIDAVMTRTLVSHKPLSKRVYHTNALANGMVDRAINAALAKGDSATNLAKAVTSLIDPSVPGGVTYAAKRLGRTEINNAFHGQSIADAQSMPWLDQMRWNLSKVHKEDPGDLCEVYARQGLFNVDQVPEKPHPNCRCFTTPEMPDYNNFQQRLLMGNYDSYLDAFIAGGSAPGLAG